MKTVHSGDVRLDAADGPFLSGIEELLSEARAGRMMILVDDEDRENEGDLYIPAQMVTPAIINFMAKYGRGLICLTLEGERVEALGLPPMSASNRSRHGTAFTTSIEAREGITTGISAADRAHTVQVAIDPRRDRRDIVTPGHIFPLQARDGGVLVRAGHTEAAVDIARMAGLNPSGVICEIMNDDGTMARLPDLIPFAQLHGLKVGTIADLIAYRRRTERLIERRAMVPFDSRFGEGFEMTLYTDLVNGVEHVALVKGRIASGGPVPVRMHALSILDDVLGDASGGRGGGELSRSIEAIADHGRGVVVLLREGSPSVLSKQLARRTAPEHDSPPKGAGALRHYGIGAQILLDLGVQDMVLMTDSPKPIIGLEGYGLRIHGTRSIGPLDDQAD